MVFTRYGRVGVNGVTSNSWSSFDAAVRTYQKTMRAKKSKGYTEIIMAASKDGGDAGGMRDPPKAAITVVQKSEIEESKLDVGV